MTIAGGSWSQLWSSLQAHSSNVYPFIPPTFALILSWVVIPLWDRYWRQQVNDVLQHLAPDYAQIAYDMARDRELRLNCIATAPSILVGLLASMEKASPGLLIFTVLLSLVFGLRLFIIIFSVQPGTHQTETVFGGRITRHDLLNLQIALLNVGVIAILILKLRAGP
jgi:hypothetical protein